MEHDEYAVINETRFRVSVQGEGSAVLLVHGGYTNLTVWDEVVESLTNEFKVIRYDHRGYGKSGIPTVPFYHYEDMKGILDHYKIQRVHIVASSFGAGVAVDFALEYPEYVDKLILAGPAINGLKYPFRLTLEGMLDYLRVKRKGIDIAAQIFMNKKFWRYVVPQDPARKREFEEQYRSNEQFYQWNPSLQRHLVPHAIARLEEIRNPVLIIEPGNDLPFNRKTCDILSQRMAGASKMVMEGCGHYPHLEKPAEFYSIVAKFLRGG